MGAPDVALAPPHSHSTATTLFRHPRHLLDPDHDSDSNGFISLASHCARVFTFTDPAERPADRDLKRKKLSQLLTAARYSLLPLHDHRALSALVSMLAANLFRDLPPPPPSRSGDDEEEEEDVEVRVPSWPHLSLAYDLLSALVAGVDDSRALRDHIDQGFLAGLLCLFRSGDPRERERVKCAWHQIYSRLPSRRAFMRRAMGAALLRPALEGGCCRGVGEMLEVCGSIVDGLPVPLEEEHRVFLTRVLMPLHKPKGARAYHRQLCFCVTRLVRKDPAVGGIVVRGLSRYWPVADCQKEAMFVGELEELVWSVGEDDGGLAELGPPLCSRVARCMNSFSSQVAERAHRAWDNEKFVRMALLSSEEVLPVVARSLEKNIEEHWSKPVRDLSMRVKKMLADMEPELYSTCLEAWKRREFADGEEEARRKERWEKVGMMASERQAVLQNGILSVSY